MAGIHFELFFYGFESFREDIEELVYLVECTSEKEGIVGLKGHLRGDRGDELSVAVDFNEEEIVEVSEAGRLNGFSLHGSAWNDFKLCGVLAVRRLVRCGVFLWSFQDYWS